MGISTEQFRSMGGSHDNFVKTKTYFMLMEDLGRYFPANKLILEGFTVSIKTLKCVGEETQCNTQRRAGVSKRPRG